MGTCVRVGRQLPFTRGQLEEAIAKSRSWSETLRRLGCRPSGGNPETVKKYAALWGVSTEHFDPYASQRGPSTTRRIPLDLILVKNSTYSRSHLKQRLYEAGVKVPICELCGQDESWRGRRMAMIVDHVNGVHDDNRLKNLRIVCPNCAATLDTHCGRKNGRGEARRREGRQRICAVCEREFTALSENQRYCSRECWIRDQRRRGRARLGRPQPHLRKVTRPPHDQLVSEIVTNGYLATARKYGVSDTAVRKWVRQYERERALAEGRDPEAVDIPRRTWPKRRRETQPARDAAPCD